jgi:hypothetical protein
MRLLSSDASICQASPGPGTSLKKFDYHGATISYPENDQAEPKITAKTAGGKIG